MGSETYHEPLELIPESTRNLHRAIVSLIEELEAVDWYQQRAGAASDPELRAVLMHHRNEEIEHAMMNLEWIRRNEPTFDAHMRTYLFTKLPITEVEEATKSEGAYAAGGEKAGGGAVTAGDSLGIGSLKQGAGEAK
jgi:ferritin-like protein